MSPASPGNGLRLALRGRFRVTMDSREGGTWR